MLPPPIHPLTPPSDCSQALHRYQQRSKLYQSTVLSRPVIEYDVRREDLTWLGFVCHVAKWVAEFIWGERYQTSNYRHDRGQRIEISLSQLRPKGKKFFRQSSQIVVLIISNMIINRKLAWTGTILSIHSQLGYISWKMESNTSVKKNFWTVPL